MFRKSWRWAAALTAVAVVLTGCSSKAAPSSNDGAAKDPGSVATDLGVTDSTIKLAISAALSGPFAASSQSIVGGAKVFWEKVNADGGVCGRKVELTVADNGYDAQKSVAAYQGFKNDVLGIQAITGNPAVMAVLPSLEQDNMIAAAVSWSSALLTSKHIAMVGASLDIEAISAVDHMLANRGLKDGDTLGFIHFSGDYGGNFRKGAEFAAKAHNLTLVDLEIAPTDVDLTAQFATIRQAGAKYVIMAAGSAQTGSLASLAQAAGYDITIVSANPGFTPSLLDGPAAGSLVENYEQVQSWVPLSSDAARDIYDAYTKANPQAKPDHYVAFAYVQGMVWREILQTACDKGNLTRAGVYDAFRSLDSLDTNGLTSRLDYSREGQPPTREVYVVKPDTKSSDGLAVVEGPTTFEDAKTYSVAP